MTRLDAGAARLSARLQAAHGQGYMVTDSLEGFPVDNGQRFRLQVFTDLYGWVHAWGLEGEFHSDTPDGLIALAEAFAMEGRRARIIELVPTLYQIHEPVKAET